MLGVDTIEQSQMRSTQSQQRLRQLHRYLTVEGSSIVIFLALSFIPYDVVFVVLAGIAMIFTPLLLVTLYKERRIGWLIGFTAVVGVPLAASFIPTENRILQEVLMSTPLLTFYLYCWVLRWAVGEWLL